MTAGQGHKVTLLARLGGLGLVILLALTAAPSLGQQAGGGSSAGGSASGGASGGAPAGASSAPKVDTTGALVPNTGGRGPLGPGIYVPGQGSDVSGLNDGSWAAMAARAEALLANTRSTGSDLDALRAQLVDWREALLGAQSANSTRIAVIQAQIAALGPLPAEGVTEAEDIARRRAELSNQLVRLQAPGLKADEAYQQADGLILQIDRLRRDRQAEELLRLWPSPLNPANWPSALAGLSATALTLWSETAPRLVDPAARGVFVNTLPLFVLLVAVSGAIFWRGRRWLDLALDRLPMPADPRAARVSRFLASLGQVVLPVIACVALTIALRRSGMLGPLGMSLAGVISSAGLAIFTAIWLGRQLFSATSPFNDVVDLPEERWPEGRFLIFACGLLIGLSRLRSLIVAQLDLDEAAASVTLFPVLLFGGLILIRIGRLLSHALVSEGEQAEDGAAMRSVIRLIGKLVTAVGVAGPALAAIGYNAAAAAMILPAAVSLGLMGLLALVQMLVSDIWAVVTRQDPRDNNALIPVLFGFGVALASLPVFALIWGADVADLTEIWARFQGGFTLGETRISPTDFLLFAVIFVIGWTATRMLQGVLKGQILPRIGMDQGGRNAIAVGTGYIGIFLSALIAINATGIDLSGLAIVAGALSVGIGFGLQAIVSNFVSGIILLIERPVSEGDWIEVGTVQGIVQSISVRSTRIQTFDKSDVIVPNQDLITGRVTNWTRFNQSGRIVVPVTAPYTTDSKHVARILSEIGMALPLALRSPAPQVVLMGFTAEAMTFELRVILKDIHNFVQARSDINHEILRRFREEGIAFTSAHRDYLARLAEEKTDALELATREAEVAIWLTPGQVGATARTIAEGLQPDQPDPDQPGPDQPSVGQPISGTKEAVQSLSSDLPTTTAAGASRPNTSAPNPTSKGPKPDAH